MNKIILNTSNISSKYSSADNVVKTFETKSNTSQTENLSIAFTKDKSSMYEYGAPADEIQQNILLANESLSEIEDIRLAETISEGASFKKGSVSINDVPYPEMDIVKGITLPSNLAPNEGATVTYILVIDQTPNVDNVTLKTTVTFDANEIQDMSEDTPTVTIEITENKLTIEKTSGQSVVISGDELLYQNVIKNVGKIKNTDIFFKDPIPEGTTFVPGSVKINKVKADETYNPAIGFSLGELDAGGQIEVSFNVTID